MSPIDKNCIGGNWICTTPGTAFSLSNSLCLSEVATLPHVSCLSGNPADAFATSVTVDSRNVQSGTLFIALSGSMRDGHDFVEDAIEAGCCGLLLERGKVTESQLKNQGLCFLETSNTRDTYGQLAELLFSFPVREMTMIGITGTNGKTTVTYLLESVLRENGKNPGVIGTISYHYRNSAGEEIEIPSPFTTPEPLLLQANLRKMADAGVDNVIMEVSSHGLEQNRIGGVLFDVGAFTGLSRDHLDYHGDMESYFLAKALLFTRHLQKGAGVVICFPENGEIWSRNLFAICSEKRFLVLSCGKKEEYDMFPLFEKSSLEKTEIVLQTPQGHIAFSSPLTGDYNVLNLMTCIGVAAALGIVPSTACRTLESTLGAPGRMQRIQPCIAESVFRPTVFVDYAHTPDALEQVLRTVKQLPHAKLYCVFGCGGDRDSGKRALMGAVAARFADVVIVTDDNPRSEDPVRIRKMIVEGATEFDFVLIPDRHKAIAATIAGAGAEDIVLIAGKGHETYQITSDGKAFFDDTLEAMTALCAWNIQSLARATGGKTTLGNNSLPSFATISTDSRQICRDDVFLALKGEHFDGHTYVDQAISAGAGALILEHMPDTLEESIPVILVADTGIALENLAAHRRACIKEISCPTVVGITGSSGKTSVKEMLAAIFNTQWPDSKKYARARVLKTVGNFNNLIGLPLSLLPVEPKHKVVILEMGMNSPGEIQRLAEIADPDIACILNVHGAHLQGLGTIEGVAQAKGELFEASSAETILVVNGDDPRVVALGEQCSQKKIVFAFEKQGEKQAEITASGYEKSRSEETAFTLHIRSQSFPVTLHVPGKHNISNALAAAAIADAAGIEIEVIAKGLTDFVVVDKRMQILDGPCRSRIINDSYNANPVSMKAGLTTLSQLGNSTRIAVLGDMLELGRESGQLHEEIGVHAAKLQIDFLFLIGEFAETMAAGAKSQGMMESAIQICATREHCFFAVEQILQEKSNSKGIYILVKGSRGMQLDKLVAKLVIVSKE